jgi:hypothetical protein
LLTSFLAWLSEVVMVPGAAVRVAETIGTFLYSFGGSKSSVKVSCALLPSGGSLLASSRFWGL